VVTSPPPAFRAAEIAYACLKKNRETTWAGLMKSGKDTRLTPEQLALVQQEMHVVGQMSLATGRSVTVTYCTECARIAFLGSSATKPAKCSLTDGCTGTPVKVATTPPKGPAELATAERAAVRKAEKEAAEAAEAEPGSSTDPATDPATNTDHTDEGEPTE
jgi:hypothetical protein